MRLWMRGQMRRRGKRGVNDSESTGKIGQEIPADQPTPLQPMYPEDKRRRESEEAAAGDLIVNAEPEPMEVAPPAAEVPAPEPEAAPAEGKLVVETQPESPSIP